MTRITESSSPKNPIGDGKRKLLRGLSRVQAENRYFFIIFLSLTISRTKYELNLSALNAMRGGDRRHDRDLPGQVPDPYDSRDSRGGRGKMGK